MGKEVNALNSGHLRSRLWRDKSCLRRDKSIGRISVTFICLLWSGVLALRAANNYYVATNGTDSGTCETWATAASNIQYAVNLAITPNDTVWVSNGTYWLTNQLVVTNAILLKSTNGWANTVVNGNFPACSNRCFFVSNLSAIVDGFTITNGFALTNHGGGVFLYRGTVQNCLITGNIHTNSGASGRGGGVYMIRGTLLNCTVKGNQSLGNSGDGGGVFIVQDPAEPSYNAIVSNCVIQGNYCKNQTGGIGTYYGKAHIHNCQILTNTAGAGCGGLLMEGSDNLAQDCIIKWNKANGGYGDGGILLDSGFMRNCLIIYNANQGLDYRGGIIQSCTISGNPVGLYVRNAGSRVDNSIIYYNTKNCDLEANAVWTNCCSTNVFTSGVGNITNAPLFVNTNMADYRLVANSPCVNVGVNRSWMTNSVDLDGRTRIRYGIVDMGAYERLNDGTIYNLW